MSPVAAVKIGPYKVSSRLSEKVFKVRTAGGREFILKRISTSSSSAQAIASRYARAREIMHPSLANVVGVEEHRGKHYLVYQYVKGLTVDEWVRKKGPSRAAVARLMRDAAETLDYLHKQGIVHGNPGAGNLIVAARGELRVVDIAPDPVADPVVDVKCLGGLLGLSLAEGGSEMSDDLNEIIERATGGAYPTARAMAEDLRDYCDGRALRKAAKASTPSVFMRTEFLAGLALLVGAGIVFAVLAAAFGTGGDETEAGPTPPKPRAAGPVSPEAGADDVEFGEEESEGAEGVEEAPPPAVPELPPLDRDAALVGWWTFDEGAGLRATDSSGSGRNGTLRNMAGNEWTKGKRDGALRFDGGDDHVDCGDEIALANKSFTLSAWARRTATGTWHTICAQGAGGTNQCVHLRFENNNVLKLGFWDNDLVTPTPYTDSSWHHWAGTYDNVIRGRKIYRDGVEVAADTAPAGFQGGGVFQIGRMVDGKHFKGELDDIRVYERVLSAEEILELAGGPDAGLVVHWKLDEANGTTAADSAGGNNGTLQNMAGTEWTEGRIAGGLAFDGKDDRVISPDLKAEFADLSVSVCVWFKATAGGVIVTEWGSPTGEGWHDSQMEIMATGEVKVRVWQLGVVLIGTVRFDEWHHAAFCYDDSIDTLKGYLDGVEAASDSRGPRAAANTQHYALGAADGTHMGDGTHFDGVMDDFRVYGRALSAKEIKALFEQPSGPKARRGKRAVAPPRAAGRKKARSKLEGLEAAEGWSAVDWGNPATVATEKDKGNVLLVVHSRAGGTKDKAVLFRKAKLDLSSKRALKLRVNNAAGRRVAFSFAVTTGEGYFEALPEMLKTGWNEDVCFELRERIYKSERTQWKHEMVVEGRAGVTEVFFIIYNGGTEADVRLDAVRFE
jgi:hypothetical protein